MKYSKSRYKKIYNKTKIPFDCEVAWFGNDLVNHLVETTELTGINVNSICGKELIGIVDQNNRPKCKSCLNIVKNTRYLNYIVKK